MFGPIKNLLNTKKASSADTAEPKVKAKKAASKGIFLEGDDARGFTSEPKPTAAKPAVAKATAPVTPAAPAAAPKPMAAPAASAPYQAFPTRRRPGANMKSFLEMAQQVKKF